MRPVKVFMSFLFLAFMLIPVWSTEANEAEGTVAVPRDNMNKDLDAFFEAVEVSDPLESMNRVFFQVNDKLYFWILKPVSTAYRKVVPADFRECFGNFFDNVAAPSRVVNNLLQGKFAGAGIDFSRFLINSTAGVLGLGDPALRSFGLEPSPGDFGQTLGIWGLGEGPYLYLPIIGPLTFRDSVGLAGDSALHPATYVLSQPVDRAAYYSADKMTLLSLHPDLYEDMKRYSLDPYISMRQAYLDYRRNKVQGKVVKSGMFDEL